MFSAANKITVTATAFPITVGAGGAGVQLQCPSCSGEVLEISSFQLDYKHRWRTERRLRRCSSSWKVVTIGGSGGGGKVELFHKVVEVQEKQNLQLLLQGQNTMAGAADTSRYETF